jgi:hypothetical protein
MKKTSGPDENRRRAIYSLGELQFPVQRAGNPVRVRLGSAVADAWMRSRDRSLRRHLTASLIVAAQSAARSLILTGQYSLHAAQ